MKLKIKGKKKKKRKEHDHAASFDKLYSIDELLEELAKAKNIKDHRSARKIRDALRRKDYYLSKQKGYTPFKGHNQGREGKKVVKKRVKLKFKK